MKFEWFHLMPWPRLPEDFRRTHRSVWVDVDRSLYDPVAGHAIYHEYLDELEHADQVGFDGICVNEHHQNAYGMMPSPNLMAATLTRRTSRAKIVVLGDSVALYNPPTRVAEEMAMLDVMSGGRLVAGFPVGTPMDTAYCYGQVPATLRDKHREAVELILRAWTAEEMFSFNGRFTQLRYVNTWPRPIQRPYPPVWIPGSRSIETWEWCVKNGFLYAYLSFFGLDAVMGVMDGFWETVERLGAEQNPYRVGMVQLVAVADSDAAAERLYGDAACYFYNRCLNVRPEFAMAPGYATVPTIKRGIGSQVAAAALADEELTWKDIVDRGYVIAGNADTVVEQLGHVADVVRIGHMMTMCHFGDLGREATMENTARFAADVAPRLRPKFAEWDDRWWPAAPLDPLAEPAPVR